jgi:formate C-acetyltransferase
MLSGIKYHVFDQKDLTLDQLLKALEDNFSGHEAVG